MLTLTNVAEKPELLSFGVQTPIESTLRPLTPSDEPELVAFIKSLTVRSRLFFSLSEDLTREARDRCESIAKYDKLRLIVEASSRVIGLFEFSLDLVDDDIERYARNGISLIRERTIRFGPCVADEYQGSGLARSVMPYVFEVARSFGRSRLILWGGVDVENKRAIGFYKNVGFSYAGQFQNQEGRICLDMFRDIPPHGR